MECEIRRVRHDFNWPLDERWGGFLNPRPGPRVCKACDGSGQNARLGVYGRCKKCRGNGSKWRRPKDKRRYDRWRPSNPPKGDGWQLWETTSEGSPISPVFATQQALISWLVADVVRKGRWIGVERTHDRWPDVPRHRGHGSVVMS